LDKPDSFETEIEDQKVRVRERNQDHVG